MPMCPECQTLSCVCEKAREMANSWHLSGLDEPQLVKLERDFMTALGTHDGCGFELQLNDATLIVKCNKQLSAESLKALIEGASAALRDTA